MTASGVFLKGHNFLFLFFSFFCFSCAQNLPGLLWQFLQKYKIQLDKAEVQDEISS